MWVILCFTLRICYEIGGVVMALTQDLPLSVWNLNLIIIYVHIILIVIVYIFRIKIKISKS